MSPDTIYVVNLGFTTIQLQEVLSALAQEEQRWTVIQGLASLSTALNSPRAKLLLVCMGSTDADTLAREIKAIPERRLAVPTLLYLAQCPTDSINALLAPEWDDFVFAPVPAPVLRLRVRWLLKQFGHEQAELDRVKQELLPHAAFKQMIGQSAAFVAVKERLQRIASCDATVLITGETGTGKEMCARAAHYLSPRAGAPFIPVNCSAIPTELFENEMFGHEQGAFTDARQARRGLVAEAEGGTLFLDEVDSLAPLGQVKLLRFLQEHEYKPLGASRHRQANVRILTATNHELKRLVKEQKFREDLYFRLQIISLHLPPLRERCADIVPLAYHFLQIAAREYKRPLTRFSPLALVKLAQHAWPGNVRELENVIRQAVVMAEGSVINAHELALDSPIIEESRTSACEPFKIAKARVIEAFEREYLEQVLAAAGGNISHAARTARKDRRTFFALLKKYGLTQLKSTFGDTETLHHGTDTH
jgi:two-component system, NtrC family, response regulator GlrR